MRVNRIQLYWCRGFVFAVVIAFLSAALLTSAYGLTAFGKNESDVINEFVLAYGWDRAKMEAYEWLGIDGELHTRRNVYEESFWNDVYKTNEELAIALGLISEVPVTGGNAASMIALAIAEWEAGVCEVPMGSNSVKYNDWYYGRHVSGPDYPWCCAFISWLANECGLLQTNTYTMTAGCSMMRSHFVSQGYESWGIHSSTPYGGTETPIPGDIIIWGGSAHIGLIVAVNDDSIETIEGNNGDRVAHFTYHAHDLVGSLGTAEIFRIQYPAGETAIFNFLVTVLELPPAGAIGVIANIAHESNFNEKALGDNGTSYGICQWHNSRWSDLRNFCNSEGRDWETLDGQLYFLQWELETKYPGLLDTLRSVPNTAQGAYTAAFAWCHDFERCVGYEFPASDLRGNTARNQYWPKYEQAGMT